MSTEPTTTEPTACHDLYGWEHPCNEPPPDPCDWDGKATMYHISPCYPENPPMREWCVGREDHPRCVLTTTTTEVEPPLPETGGPVVAGGVGLLFCAVGVLLARVARRA